MFALIEASGAYGKTPILRNVSLSIHDGEIVALLGRNGSGKTTTMKYIMGLLDRTGGEVRVDGKAVGHQPETRARAGLGYVPQGRYVFPRLTTAENISAAAVAHGRKAVDAVDEAFALFPTLVPRAHALAGLLSGGQQQMLAMARALATRPKVLVLDEPTEGIQPSIVDEIGDILRRSIAGTVPCILIAEQNLDFALALASRAYVIDRGEVSREGASADLLGDQAALQSLLGV